MDPEKNQPESSVDRPQSVFRNRTATMPDTANARHNDSTLRAAIADIGLTELSKAVGHDKSWGSRVLSNDSLFNWNEMLHILDTTRQRVKPIDEGVSEDTELLSALLRHTASSVDRRISDDLSGGRWISEDEYRALLTMTRKAISCMQDRMK